MPGVAVLKGTYAISAAGKLKDAGETILFAGNHDVGPDGGHAGKHRVRIVAFVGQHIAGPVGGEQQVCGASTIGLLARPQHDAQRVAQRVVLPGVTVLPA